MGKIETPDRNRGGYLAAVEIARSLGLRRLDARGAASVGGPAADWKATSATTSSRRAITPAKRGLTFRDEIDPHGFCHRDG
jgi:hypothetical protein